MGPEHPVDKNPSDKDPCGDLGGLCSAPRAKRLAACCSALSFSCSVVSARVLGEKGLERRRFGGRASCQLSRSCVNRLGARRAWGLRRGRAPARRARQLCERQGIWCWEKRGGRPRDGAGVPWLGGVRGSSGASMAHPGALGMGARWLGTGIACIQWFLQARLHARLKPTVGFSALGAFRQLSPPKKKKKPTAEG